MVFVRIGMALRLCTTLLSRGRRFGRIIQAGVVPIITGRMRRKKRAYPPYVKGRFVGLTGALASRIHILQALLSPLVFRQMCLMAVIHVSRPSAIITIAPSLHDSHSCTFATYPSHTMVAILAAHRPVPRHS